MVAWIAFTVLWEVVHLQILVPSLGEKPFEEGFRLMAENLLLPMSTMIALGIGVLLFLVKYMIINRQKQEKA